MTLSDIKNISIREYLGKLGIKPIKENEWRGMYHSPLREDKNASFSVDFTRNVWFDHGLGKGGSIIDLILLVENISIADAINKLETNYFSFHRNDNTDKLPTNEKPGFDIQKNIELSNPALFQYLQERKINIEVAKEHCKEIHYSTNRKKYFAIGFQNNTNGYELRNKYFKGCTSKDITTHLGTDRDSCLVFEGFIDYLSYLSLKGLKTAKQDILILNSVSNLSKAINFIQSHSKVYTYLDNDEAGKKATEEIKSVCNSISDQSPKYSQHKDLNDLLCGKKLVESRQAGLQESKLSGKEAFIQEGKKIQAQTSVKKKMNRGFRM